MRKRKPGRPKSSAAEKRAAKLVRKEDGERLNKALQELKLTQKHAAQRSGVNQGTLNHFVNGKRSVTVEDLRKLGKIGIPPDYVLGLTEKLLPPGQSRSHSELVTDLFAEVQRRLVDQGTVLDDLPTGFDVDATLSGITTIVENDLQKWPTYRSRIDAVVNSALAIENALNSGDRIPRLVREQMTEARAQLTALAREITPEVRIFGGYIFDSLEKPAADWGTKVAVPRRKRRRG
jgi:transcriptional regulator with XRE-family HTH domain